MKRLLEILLASIEGTKNFSGMCGEIMTLQINKTFTFDEGEEVLFYIEHNPPKGVDVMGYWWKPGDKTPRIQWLKEQIEKL